MTRAQRRLMKRKAADTAARMAAACYDFHGNGSLVRITDRHAVAALRRGFEALLNAGGVPQAQRITDAEASGFPRHKGGVPGGVTWLAVGFDAEMRASYALQSARDGMGDDARSDGVARAMALHLLTGVQRTRGFPMGKTMGNA